MGSRENLLWHYAVDGEKFGPVTSSELRRQVLQKKLKPTDLVWKTGLSEWIPASKIKGLFDPPTRSHAKDRRPESAGEDAEAEIPEVRTRSQQSRTLVRSWDSDDEEGELVEVPRKRKKKKRKSTAREPENYAGFWFRLIPFLIDYVLSGLMFGVIVFGLLYINYQIDPDFELGGWISHSITWFASLFSIMIYYVFMEASPLQATPGKLMFGLRVGNAAEEPAWVPALIVREMVKFLPGMLFGTFIMDEEFFRSYMEEQYSLYHLLWLTLFIPYLVAGITPRKQALYDLIAGTYVYSYWE